MNKKTLSLIMLSVLMLAAYVPMVSAHGESFPGDYDTKHFVIDTIGPPETLDPAWCYDTASAELIMNVYDSLVTFDIDYRLGPYEAGLPSSFAPRLATRWWTQVINEYDSVTGLTWLRRMTFEIRFTNATGQPVTFHNGEALTMEDVEYSFERWMVQDRAGGPTWMIYQPLLNCYKAKPPTGAGSDANFGIKIDRAVQHNDTHLWFNLATTYPGVTVLQILSQGWSSVVNKVWCEENGDLNITMVPGGWENWAAIYNNDYGEWHDPAESPIEGDMLGTGPYEFGYWEAGTGWEIDRYNNFWDGWPARVRFNTDERLGGYLNKVTEREIPEWTTRKTFFETGVADTTAVPRMYRDQVLGIWVCGEKVKCMYPYDTLACTNFFYTYNINTISPYMGVPGGLAPSTFSQAGIPPNIFNDTNVRKGIAYLFDYKAWLEAAYLGEGWQPSDYIVSGLTYDNPAQEMYKTNATKGIEYLQEAWDGDLWTNGMKFTIVYNVGNVPRQTAAEMIRDKLNAANSKFHVEAMGAAWGTVMLPQMVSRQLPIFLIGWLADFPDPHNFAFPFAHSLGTFAAYQGYNNPVVDALIDAGIEQTDDTTPYPVEGQPGRWLDIGDPRKPFTNATGTYGFNNYPTTPYTTKAEWLAHPPDTRWPRRSIYYALQAIAQDDAASVAVVQALGRHFEQQWVRGWYYNPIDPGYNYNRFWKAETHYADVDGDGDADSIDAASLSAHWYSPPAYGGYGYAPQADLTGGKGGTTGMESGYLKGVSDGRVNIVDVGLLSAYYDGIPPYGPSHPEV